MKEKQATFLRIIEEDQGISFNDIIKLLENQRIRENQKEFKSFLYLLLKISKNHQRCPNFFSHFEKILLHYKNQILQFFPNSEIFKIFKGNKRLLLFLIKERILTIDQFVSSEIKSDKYNSFFSHELNEFDNIENLDDFERNRLLGENESYICKLIRDDSVQEFVAYTNKINLSISSGLIKRSTFETNSFLINKTPSLIEYAAFFGSIQIFQYLNHNHVDLSPSLWLYAIHGKNGEIIHLLEENQVVPEDKTFQECYEEALKCHHNDIAQYIKENLLQVDKNQTYDPTLDYLKYYNLACVQDEQINSSSFNYLCRFDYDILVELLLRNGNIDVNAKIIYTFFFLIEFE